MSTTETFPHALQPLRHAITPVRRDLLRLAGLLTLFAALSLTLSLAADAPGALLGDVPTAGPDWHGNSTGGALR